MNTLYAGVYLCVCVCVGWNREMFCYVVLFYLCKALYVVSYMKKCYTNKVDWLIDWLLPLCYPLHHRVISWNQMKQSCFGSIINWQIIACKAFVQFGVKFRILLLKFHSIKKRDIAYYLPKAYALLELTMRSRFLGALWIKRQERESPFACWTACSQFLQHCTSGWKRSPLLNQITDMPALTRKPAYVAESWSELNHDKLQRNQSA